MTLTEREIAAGLRPSTYPDLSSEPFTPQPHPKRVKWVNELRKIVARRMPRNKCGVPIVSDVDLLLATEEERGEALKVLAK